MDVPIPCACTLDTSHHPSGLKTSLRLYGLVRIVGFSDTPASTPVEILCAASGEGKAIRAFVSRLDAELVARSMPDSGYRVVPLAQFDPTGFIQQHQGWLTVHITCGFSSQRDTLRLADGDLPSLGWFSPDSPLESRALYPLGRKSRRDITQCLPQRWYAQLQRLNQLDDYSTLAMDNCVEIAWQTLLACRPMRENHQALFNPMDECWRFSDSPIDHCYPI
ncbi:hypothetical protein [Pseudomonas sp. GM50]|uniref:hypothetical protein n=1 Tax=Pseudomonas sp. GM50 TaxID=1144332 RepID=UPI0009DB63D6|nr:hypothetical protein [Pseudomonas sp. GM50]